MIYFTIVLIIDFFSNTSFIVWNIHGNFYDEYKK